MGMFGEINAAGNAKSLERVLRVAMKYQSEDVWEFARNHIYPLYCSEIGESWGGYKEPDDIKKAFDSKTVKPKKNPQSGVTFKLNPCDEEEKEAMKDLSGRIIYSKGENFGVPYWGGDEKVSIDFYCGPETKGGALDDSYDMGIYDQLDKLFEANKIDADVGASENHHEIFVPKGITAEELWKKVVTLLELAGAVEMKD